MTLCSLSLQVIETYICIVDLLAGVLPLVELTMMKRLCVTVSQGDTKFLYKSQTHPGLNCLERSPGRWFNIFSMILWVLLRFT
jgi:hypothetical protein